jgi:hypothetical protein
VLLGCGNGGGNLRVVGSQPLKQLKAKLKAKLKASLESNVS